ncbi:hypothetical protein quinque_007674 [Culex quinquefasciatus]
MVRDSARRCARVPEVCAVCKTPCTHGVLSVQLLCSGAIERVFRRLDYRLETPLKKRPGEHNNFNLCPKSSPNQLLHHKILQRAGGAELNKTSGCGQTGNRGENDAKENESEKLGPSTKLK